MAKITGIDLEPLQETEGGDDEGGDEDEGEEGDEGEEEQD